VRQLFRKTKESPRKKSKRGIPYRIGRLFLLIYLAVLATLLALESRLVYPGAYKTVDPSDWEERADGAVDWNYRSSDGVELTGQIIHADDQRPIVYFHGNGTKAIWATHFIRRLSQATGSTVLAAEYRGFLNDDHHPNEKGLVLDSLAAFDDIVEKLGVEPESITVWGSSLGGGCAAAVAQVRPVRAVILERSFDSLVNVASGMYWFLPVKALMRNRFDSVDRLRKYQGPLLQLHGDVDRIVPIARARNLESQLATTKSVFEEYSGWGHNDFVEDHILDNAARWLSQGMDERSVSEWTAGE